MGKTSPAKESVDRYEKHIIIESPIQVRYLPVVVSLIETIFKINQALIAWMKHQLTGNYQKK